MFSLQIKRKQLRFIEGLSSPQKKSVKSVLSLLKSDPVPVKMRDVVKLKGHVNTYRIRIGRIRIVYTVDWGARNIVIQFVGLRGKAYRKPDD